MSAGIARCLREPLVQFLLAGALLFVAHRGLNARVDPAEEPGRIELTKDDIRQIRLAWLAQGRPAPSPEQLRSLVDARVREEILYREALALGLDRDDTIVRRRMAQKMEFLFEDVGALREPTTADVFDIITALDRGQGYAPLAGSKQRRRVQLLARLGDQQQTSELARLIAWYGR